MAQRKRVRDPVAAGVYYPAQREEILDYFRGRLVPGKGGRAQAIIAPHGSWDFSGSLTVDAFSSATGRSGSVKRVVILGPIHDKREKGLFLSDSHSFYTPLGNISIDQKITKEFERSGVYFEINDVPHLAEHSIEILLPFIKHCFPYASIVPILMGQQRHEIINDLAQSLRNVITPVLDETLLIVSCNLSCNNNKDLARRMAEDSLRLFSEKNANRLYSAILNGSINSCGGGLVAALLESGLLDRTQSYSSADNLVSALGTENDTVFYSSVSFM